MRPILCDFKNCTSPAVVLKNNINLCAIHQYS